MAKKKKDDASKILILSIAIIALIIIVLAAFVVIVGSRHISRRAFGFGFNETNPAVCENLTSAARDTCYNVVAVNTKDLALCGKINGTWQKDICQSGVSKKLQP